MNEETSTEKWVLSLYIAGMTPAAHRALDNIKAICEEHLQGKYSLEVIDLIEQPGLAEVHQIFAVPTVVRQLPSPLRKIIGDLADSERVLVGLELHAAV
jgi:circadian clock protein KaiB